MKSAIVQTAQAEHLATCIAIEKEIAKSEKKTREHFVELGKALWRLKEATQRGTWLAALARAGIAQQRASEAMRAAKLPIAVIAQANNVSDLINALPSENGEMTDAAEPPDPPAEPRRVLCKRCRRVGAIKDCEKCAKLQSRVSKSRKAKSNEVKDNGKPLLDWRHYDTHFTQVIQHVDKIPKAYPAEKQSQEYRDCIAHLRAYGESMKQWRIRITKESR